ncbi:MAG TPA: PilZ domain-containing protein [Sphingomicrobium sp.]|nr:PilZ domain-containing protein [Sphingomicrobium sp.]
MNTFRQSILSGMGLYSADPLVRGKKGRGAASDDLGSVEVPRNDHRSANHRDDDRHRLDRETALARFKGKEQEVELINLSGGGAMIRAGFAPRLWDRVDLIFDEGAEIECAVRWLKGDRIGLEFAHETRIDCAPEQRDALLLEVLHRSFPDAKLAPRPHAAAAIERSSDDNDTVANSRRTDRRHPLIWSGTVLCNHNSEKVRLRNISEHGALIEGPTPYPVGIELFLDLDEAGQHFATVSWTCADKIGLRFEKPFDMKLLGSTRPQVAPELMIRPGPHRIADDNPWADGWQRQSIDELRDDLEGYLKR